MEKFSLYDLLGLIMPGIIFVFLGQIILSIFSLCPTLLMIDGFEYSTVISLSLAIIIGAFLFASNFILVNKCKLYNAITGMYQHVADIYQNMDFLHHIMNSQLNFKTLDWFGHEVYTTKSEYELLSSEEKDSIKQLQDESYDRIYYELEYLKFDSQTKTAQSFYFFFRQSALAFIILLMVLLSLYLFSFLKIMEHYRGDNGDVLFLGILILCGALLSISLAKWFRKRMVMKLYWSYFTYLNQQKN